MHSKETQWTFNEQAVHLRSFKNIKRTFQSSLKRHSIKTLKDIQQTDIDKTYNRHKKTFNRHLKNF